MSSMPKESPHRGRVDSRISSCVAAILAGDLSVFAGKFHFFAREVYLPETQGADRDRKS